ncbi:MAG: flavin reductase [Clostridia bacterium]|nr:flavin reductase [Clostridia bacterium]
MRKNLKVIPGIFPMPVLMIGTYNEDGSVDVMNAAWGMAYDFKQIKLNISDSHKTTKNIRRTGCFTVSLATKDTLVESDYFGIVSGNNVKDKFEKTKMTAIKSEYIDAPIILQYPICMECRAIEIDGEYGVLGEIINLSVEEEYLDKNGNPDLSKINTIAYDPFTHGYYEVNKKVGQAFEDGKKLI